MRKIGFLMVVVALTVVAGVKLGAARSATPTGDLLEALPDGIGVVVVDFQKIAGSSLWATINAQEKLKSAIDKAQSEMSDLGVKLSDVHSAAMVFPAAA